MMHLEGWVHPLPDYLEEAILYGLLVVRWEKNKYQYLLGVVTNPQGTVIDFR